MELQIPVEDSESSAAFSSTVDGKIVQVNYYLKVYIRYDDWSESFDGHCATMPIEILQPPKQLVMQTPMMMPAGFRPVMQNQVHFGIPVAPQQQVPQQQ